MCQNPLYFYIQTKFLLLVILHATKTHSFCLTQPVTWWGAAKNWMKKVGMNMHIFIKRLLFNSLCGNLKYKYTLINSSTCITYPIPGLVLKRNLHNNDTFVLEKRTQKKNETTRLTLIIIMHLWNSVSHRFNSHKNSTILNITDRAYLSIYSLAQNKFNLDEILIKIIQLWKCN